MDNAYVVLFYKAKDNIYIILFFVLISYQG